MIGEETIKFEEKNITQFVIKKKTTSTYNHSKGDFIYKPVIIEGSGVRLLTMGVVYNFETDVLHPYSYPGDKIQVSNPGFETSDPKIVKTGTNQTRWLLSHNLSVNSPTVPAVQTALNEVTTDVSAILQMINTIISHLLDIHPTKILDGSVVTQEVLDQKLLRIIRKQSNYIYRKIQYTQE